MIRPDGSMRDEVKMLTKKAEIWTDAIRTRKIRPSEAWYCLTATIMKTLEYPLVATTFTQQQVNEIMKPILKVALNKCGLQKKLPRKLLYGTLKTRGIHLKNIFLLQLILHSQSILKHAHKDTPSNDLHIKNMDLVQMYVGSQESFWQLPFQWYGSLAPEGWIKSTWKDMDETPLTLKGPSITLLPLRKKDVFLTDAFIEAGYEGDDLITLRDCQLRLGVTRLSEIATANGAYTTEEAWKGQPSKIMRHQEWIKTCRLPATAWTLCQEALRECFLFPNATHIRLRQRMGSWLHKRDNEWIWWRHTHNFIYEHRAPGQWYRWSFHRIHQGKIKFCNPQPVPEAEVPEMQCRVCITRSSRSNLVNLNSTGDDCETPAPVPSNSLEQRIKDLPEEARWAIQHLNLTDNGVTIAQAISQGKAVGVSDGSLKHGLGTAGIVLEGEDDTNRIRCVNKVPGPIKEGDSHRCEMSGLYGLVLLVKTICQLHNRGTQSLLCQFF